ncbi:Calcineurin-like phosphoesterase [Gemmata sp. SH-PL17]|uniref:purple acid phosphatase family protein n=1 Tax=Gemmata sp. SH-PL17 TaxID=1630693 RepID=UPI0004B40F5B|nr:metallophosphoesterase family protein [Gemmata sp. SH-PL17]AMV25058.1 Calcineurin-like phosphoesterase [Gemmata sp. SH-PL17]
MARLTRRAFFGSALTGFAAVSSGHAPPLTRAVSDSPLSSWAPTGAPDGLFLTWQRDPTTTVTVRWIGPRWSGETSVSFALFPMGETWQVAQVEPKPFPGTNLSVYRAEITGLSPGSEYQFRVGNRPFTHRFRTMPARATDAITFVSGGDCGANAHAVATNLLAAKQEPHFVLLGGDLAYDNGRSPETFLAFLRNYSTQMIDPVGRLIPLVACIGNHEVNGAVGAKREGAPAFLSVFDGLFRDTTFGTLDFGDYLSLVLLDSGHVAPVGSGQSEWLEKTLREREGYLHLFAANHVPAYPSARDPGEAGAENRKHWCPLFERYGVDAVLEHHDHTFKRTHPLKGGLKDKYGVPYLGDGSWGQLRAPALLAKRPYLVAASRAYHLTLHRLEGASRFHVALEAGGAVADVYGTEGKRPARRG